MNNTVTVSQTLAIANELIVNRLGYRTLKYRQERMNYNSNNLNSDRTVTILITRRPRQENQQEFEQALSDSIDAALEFPGHLGVTVLKPPRGDNNDYQIIVMAIA